VRLDHLLSKEQPATAFALVAHGSHAQGMTVRSRRAGRWFLWVVLEGGTLTNSAAGSLPAPSTARPWFATAVRGPESSRGGGRRHAVGS
jgi:hypothetical protein